VDLKACAVKLMFVNAEKQKESMGKKAHTYMTFCMYVNELWMYCMGSCMYVM